MTTAATGSPRSGPVGPSAAMASAIAGVFAPAGRRARLAVLTYHQVLAERDPLRPDEPCRAEFVSDLDVIRRVFTVLPLPEASRRLASRTLPARAACITFDDGYANNHGIAAPLLEAAGLPATFFIACGAVDEGVMWNDLLIETVARCSAPPRVDALREFLGETASGLQGADLVRALLRALKYQPLERRLAISRQFFADNVPGLAPNLMMSRDQVRNLAERGFDVGGHTVRHPILKSLGDVEAKSEIESCSAWLADVIGRQPISFAYPNGRPGIDFGARDAAFVRAAGFEVAVSTKWALAKEGDDAYSIPRVGPWWRHGHTLAGGMLRLQLVSYLPR